MADACACETGRQPVLPIIRPAASAQGWVVCQPRRPCPGVEQGGQHGELAYKSRQRWRAGDDQECTAGTKGQHGCGGRNRTQPTSTCSLSSRLCASVGTSSGLRKGASSPCSCGAWWAPSLRQQSIRSASRNGALTARGRAGQVVQQPAVSRGWPKPAAASSVPEDTMAANPPGGSAAGHPACRWRQTPWSPCRHRPATGYQTG